MCGSYDSGWKYLQQLTMESNYDKVVQKDHWLWVYDNLNIHQKVRHEREGKNQCVYKLYSLLILILIILRSPLEDAKSYY